MQTLNPLIIAAGIAAAAAIGWFAHALLVSGRVRRVQNETWRHAEIFFRRRLEEELRERF